MSSSIPWHAVGAVALPLAGGHLSGYVGKENYGAWYDSLKKPDWKPPRLAFPITWTALYSGMGYASYLVWKEGGGFSGPAKLPLAAYGVQLAFNFAWSPIFFGQRSIKGGMIDILILDVAAIGASFLFYKISPTAGYIMLPYLAWLSLATALNYRILKDNPEKQPEAKDK